ncbi:class I adenylate cyclase [Reinekea forsetii]|nr:class I adenylate cyclase [Reinekea forsetii]
MEHSNFLNDQSPIGFIGKAGASALHVNEVRKRFHEVNEGRLQRLKEGLQLKQQQCFELLPLLFHVHQRGLPGYLEATEMPRGIAFYQPHDALLRSAQSLTRQTFSTQLVSRPEISALYLMGSSGSIGQSTSSDLDIWLCYDSELSQFKIKLLNQKCEAISHWASGFNLEVHFFLMNAQKFQGGEQQSLTGENCGSTSHTLLLDEFYRTAQLIAGGLPAWWFVPTSKELEHEGIVKTLVNNGHISTKEVTDFGGVSKLDAGEFIGAGLWQIYKAIDAPYKSVLKLILLEIYAREFPKVISLAHSLKNAVYRMNLSLDNLDPYVMLYQRIEAYLVDRGEKDRLELLRRCFYFKVGINVSKPTRTRTWRRELMEVLVQSWGWTKHTVQHLDNHRQWSIESVINERRLLVSELTRSYRFLTEFAAEHHSAHVMSQRDLLILSRKLHAAFDRRPGKIDFIKIGLDIDLSNEKIRLHERESKQKGSALWAAYNQPIDEIDSASPLKYSQGLLETLLWCHLNGLLSAHLHIPIQPLKEKISDFEIRMTIASLRQHLPTPLAKINPDRFYHPAHITKAVLFVNLGRDPLAYLSARGLQKISERSDSMDFSSLRENLIISIDMVLVNSWGEVVVERYDDHNVTANAIRSLVGKINKQHSNSQPELNVVCNNETRPHAIAKRINDLFDDAINALCRSRKSASPRFIYHESEEFLVFQKFNNVISYRRFSTEKELIQQLGEEQTTHNPVIIDRLFQAKTKWLKPLLSAQKPQAMTIGFERHEQRVAIRLIDEKGSLIVFDTEFFNVATLISPLVRFLKITEHRQRSIDIEQFQGQRQIQCIEFKSEKGQYKAQRTPVKGLINKGHFISIQVNVDVSSNGSDEFVISCNEKEFSSNILGDNLYTAVASYILGIRASGKKYPAYITDIALSENFIAKLPYGMAQTKHYLESKLRLEKKINLAMASL